ncbi:PHOsphatase [Homalodisca vitripennis]|nr:PHOsphatase [Homalodisca vitripennis]
MSYPQTVHESITQGKSATPVVIYFTHNGMFERFFARLGLLNSSSPPTAQFDFSDIRAWRLAKYIPFAANLAVTLHNCTGGYKVAIYLNERPLQLEFCTNGLCEWQTLYDRFHTLVDSSTCNLDDCYVGTASLPTPLFIATSLLLLIIPLV